MIKNVLIKEILGWDNREPAFYFDMDNETFAFEETYLTPFWDYCKHRITSEAKQSLACFGKAAFYPWKVQLCRQLAQWTVSVMWRILQNEQGYSAHTEFLEAAVNRLFLTEPIKAWERIFAERPALDFIYPRIITDFINHAVEVAERVAGYAEEMVTEVGTGVSDLHNSGRCVHIITFASGKKTVYKPRDMKVDIAWNKFLTAMTRMDGAPTIFSPKATGFHDYAFEEYVEANPARTESEVSDFFFKSGYLQCLILALGGSDYHVENIIASGSDPVLIDLETIISKPSDSLFKDSHVLYAKFLPYLSISKKLEAGFPAMTARLNSSKNLPVLNGVDRTAFDYREQFIDGFKTCFDIIVKNMDTLLSENSPVNLFKGCCIRYLKRDTNWYMKALNILSSPARFTFQNEGEMIKKIDDIVGYKNEEERSLRFGYIPFFTVNIDSLQHVFDNIRSFTEQRKKREIAIIETVLNKKGSDFTEDENGSIRLGFQKRAEADEAKLIYRFIDSKIQAWITLINDEILSGNLVFGIVAEQTRKRHFIANLHLFFLELLLGIVVVMAAWYKISRCERAKTCLDACFAKMQKELAICPLKNFSPCLLEGASGVAVAASRIYELTGNETAFSICGGAAEVLEKHKPGLLSKHGNWSNILLYGETGIVFALASLPPSLQKDNHKKIIQTYADRFMSLDYTFSLDNSGVSPYTAAKLLRAFNTCAGTDIPIPWESALSGDYSLKTNDNYCFGNAGALAFLDRRTAFEIAASMVLKAERKGGFSLNAASREFPFPGFFYGEAGVLYSLLRLLTPDEIPYLF